MMHYGIPAQLEQDNTSNFALLSTLKNGRSWIKECMMVHTECQVKNKFVPTRLIDVGLPEGPDNLKLIETRQSGTSNSVEVEYGQYATLSHCWGQSEHITTKTDTLEKRKAGILFHELNRTFQDAVLVTRALGIRYVWIDSLCIIQGSESDWQKESSLMGSVYSGGTINIAADAAEDGDQGFLSKKIPTCFPYTLPDKQSHGVLHMKTSKRKRWVEYSGNLRKRAWVLQEYTLSPCSIRYGMNGITWECRCGCRYDSEVIMEENQFRQDMRALKTLPLQIRTVSPSSAANQTSEVMALWRKLVIEYSRKDLTFEEDVLPALSGLASLVHNATGDQYLAGIWRGDLPMALQWVAEIQEPRSTTPLAPTWSWAACRKSISIMYPVSSATQFKVKILDAGVTTVDADYPFGRVLDGFLKLEGLIQQVTFKRISPHLPALKLVLRHNEKQIGSSIGYMKYDGDVAALPPVWCLQLSIQPRKIFPTQRNVMNSYGVLILEEDKGENVFRRLAFKNCWMEDFDWDGAKRETIVIK